MLIVLTCEWGFSFPPWTWVVNVFVCMYIYVCVYIHSFICKSRCCLIVYMGEEPLSQVKYYLKTSLLRHWLVYLVKQNYCYFCWWNRTLQKFEPDALFLPHLCLSWESLFHQACENDSRVFLTSSKNTLNNLQIANRDLASGDYCSLKCFLTQAVSITEELCRNVPPTPDLRDQKLCFQALPVTDTYILENLQTGSNAVSPDPYKWRFWVRLLPTAWFLNTILH